MPEFKLAPEPFLGGYSGNFGANRLEEATDLSIVSIACPQGGREALESAVSKAWSLRLPAPGRTASAGADGPVLMFTAPDQYFALLPAGGDPPLRHVQTALGDAAYCTDQSDNWVALRMSGPLASAALERICPVDIDPSAFPAGSATRTVLEHIGGIVFCEEEGRFLLLAPSSFAGSFLHAAETSIKYVS